MSYYAQCHLERDKHVDIAWIPEKFAVEGKTVRVKQEDGSWADGWLVKHVYGRISEDEVVFNRDKHMHHRKATDI